ncbi:transcriptional regulator [Catellatospora sp. IY07-71]|uniref:AAA family ATPase n=1 Tax=Catellatospora sp. IY07-71 TaxID=2728827 RepID=UPI001BB33894|nr:helix-turn-helix transcriptional regulator [Catellatospora sp. IY07-71]BCJ74869.1 transcriptional regulator [Catellatospora sp. IY07-71]
MLYGRAAEQETVERLLRDVTSGRPRALIVRGEAGIGKSALLEYAAASTPARVLRVTGVQSEADLPFAALHVLLRPLLDRVAALPPQQSDALLGALGLGSTNRGDRFLVGLATLSLLVEVSATTPLLCLIDDAHWLDGESADALLFAARRLGAESVAMLFATRESERDFSARGLPDLRLGRLEPEAAGRIVAEHAADLPPAVRDQLVAEAQGNPLALVELPSMLTAEHRFGGNAPLSLSFGTATPVLDRVFTGFRDRVEELPEATRACLLVAALDDRGDLGVLAAALEPLGARLDDFAAAERAGLVRVGVSSVAFRHPLVRTAVVLAGDVAARMAAHRALAAAVDGDRRAWHLAAVTPCPDDAVADDLEDLALRAQRRGGQAAVSAAYARAAELSADPAVAARRRIAAASAAIEAGLWRRAGELVGEARRRTVPLAPAVLAELAMVRAKLEAEAGRPLAAVRLLHEAAAKVTELPTLLSLLSVASYLTWSSARHPDQLALARRTEELSPPGDGPAAALRGINSGFRRILEGDAVTTYSYPKLRDGVTSMPVELRMLVVQHALVRADSDGMSDYAEAMAEECRTQGRLGRLPQALTVRAIAEILGGRHRSARATVAQAASLAADVGQPMWSGYLAGMHAWLAAAAGAEQECLASGAEALRDAERRAWMPGGCWAEYARVLLDLGAGRYEAVLERLDHAATGPSRHAFVWRYTWPDYVEAAARVGQPDRAVPLLSRYAEWVTATGQDGPRAVLDRARALLAADDEADAHYQRALELHSRARQPFDEARTRLLYGEWLRRQQRRAAARAQLEAAREAFDALDAAPWSARAATELRAAGVSLPDRAGAGDLLAELTAQELQVVRLAMTGASNRQIGAQLFLSPRTVASHLYKAFPKLGVTSRAELSRLAPLS